MADERNPAAVALGKLGASKGGKALNEALGIDTVRELAEHKFVRIAQAVTGLSH
jgi:hypothetical protein